MYKAIVVILALAALIFSCKKQEIGPQCPTCIEDSIQVKVTDVLIGCEGNFGWGNSSISLYNPIEMTVSNSVFQNVNGYALGDVLQSIYEFNGKLFLVVNNSGKIEVLDTSNYVSTTTINGFTSPRYLCGVNANKAYVSDLYANQISIIDLTTYAITSSIATNGWTEQMISINNKVFVARPDTNLLLQINATTDVIEDTIVIAKGASNFVLDKNEKLWVICSGGYNEEFGSLNQIDPVSNTVTQTFTFSNLNESPSSLAIDSSKSELFYLNNGVYQFSINDNNLSSSPIIQENGAIFYGLGVSPTNNIYVSDAVDYVQPGIVYRYSLTGNILDQFTTGIIPQQFWFK